MAKMYRHTSIFILFFQLGIVSAQVNFTNIISYIAADSLEGREPATKGDTLTQNYLIQFFKNQHLTIKKQSFAFTFNQKTDSATNILAYCDNQQDSTIVITAHYDHLGWGNNKSREIIHKHQIHNGADDNASGVAMLLMLAKYLTSDSNQVKATYNYLFVGYGAHELGLFGSKYFVESEIAQKLKIKVALNFDMVGRLNKTNPILKIGGTIRDTCYNAFFKKYENEKLHFRLADEQLLQSDATFLYEKKIPTFTFTTGIHEDYHRAGDDSHKINYEGLTTIFRFMQAFLNAIAP